MANCQNNMRCPRRQPMPSSSCSRSMEGCPDTHNDFLEGKPLAMAYVPWQMFDEVMDGCGGLAHGTIFEELVFPFVGSQAACQSRRYCDLNGRNTMENRSSCPCGRGRSFR